MRTQEELVARMRASALDDLFGFAREVIFPFLSLENAKEFTKKPELLTPETWTQPRDEEAVKKELASYMEFAWGKVENHRGLSANRSVTKLSTLVWILGDDITCKAVHEAEYAQYGAPMLAIICKAYNLPIPQNEGIQRMIKGLPCTDSCSAGCGE